MVVIVVRIVAPRSEARSGLAMSSSVRNRAAPALKANVRVPRNPFSRRPRVKQVHKPAPRGLDVGVGVGAVGVVRVVRVARRRVALALGPRTSPVGVLKRGFPKQRVVNRSRQHRCLVNQLEIHLRS